MKPKKKTIGGKEYMVIGSTTEMERGQVVFQSYTTYGGKVVIENGKVTHPDGSITDFYGKPLLSDNIFLKDD